MALTQIFATVNALLPSDVTTAVGIAELARLDAPRRVVWVPTREPFTGSPTTAYNSSKANPRTIAARLAHVEAHIWGADLDDAELLVNAVCAAIYEGAIPQAPANYQFRLVEGQWQNDGPRDVAAGVGYVLLVEFTIPVVLRAQIAAAPTDTPLTRKFVKPDGTTVTETP